MHLYPREQSSGVVRIGSQSRAQDFRRKCRGIEGEVIEIESEWMIERESGGVRGGERGGGIGRKIEI